MLKKQVFTLSKRAQGRGFGLLETVAALTILAAGVAVLFPWVSQSLKALERGKAAEARAIATMQSVRWLDALDANTQASGEQVFETFKMRWNLAPLNNPPMRLTNEGGQFRVFTSTLFQGKVEISQPDGGAWFDYEHAVVAYTRSTVVSNGPFQ